jgi:hypothetical protein
MSADPSEISGALAKQMVQNSKVHFNVDQETIIITEDKIRLCMHQHLGRVEARREWIAPTGVLITLLIIFPTTTFKDFIFTAAVWTAIFVIATLITFAWLIRAIIRARRAPSVEDIVRVMKRESARELGGTGT